MVNGRIGARNDNPIIIFLDAIFVDLCIAPFDLKNAFFGRVHDGIFDNVSVFRAFASKYYVGFYIGRNSVLADVSRRMVRNMNSI